MDTKNNEFEKIMNLNTITRLINLLGKNQDITGLENNITLNYKNYNISKDGNSIIIKCSDGRKLSIKIGENTLYYGYGKYQTIYFELKLLTLNGELIRMVEQFAKKNNESTNNFFSEYNFNYYNLINDYKIDYFPNDEFFYYQLVWNNGYKRFIDGFGPIHTYKGYVYYDGSDKYLISEDLDKIISLNHTTLPSLEEMNNFNIEEERNKINEILIDYKSNELGKKIIEEVMNNLESKKELIKKVNKAYKTILPRCKEDIAKELEINEMIKNNIFTKEELELALKVLKEMINENNKTLKLSK